MEIALDTNSLYVTRAGTSRYVRGLQKGFRELSPRGLSIREFAWPVDNFQYHQPWRGIKTLYREIIWSQIIAPIRLAARKTDLLHRCTPSCPIRKPGNIREVVTLHDLAILRHPERFRRWHRWADTRRLSLLSRADLLICDSQFTADEATSLLGLSPSRMEVIPLGHDFDPLVEGTPPEWSRDLLRNGFFLFVGSLEPGKNLALLREVYAQASSHGRSFPPLAIVGTRWSGVPTEGAPDRQWHYLGNQPDSVLAWLYRNALALVFPSKYEGFGLPVLEAMAMGCPVICSRVASLGEVGGDCPLYARMDAASYAESMTQIQSDDSLRRDLSRRGRERASLFSWKTCAAHTIEVYHKAMRRTD